MPFPRNIPLRNRYLKEGAPKSIGLALSGGGQRSAILNLGVLQALRATAVIDRIKWLAAVSGGGYIAGAMYMTGALSGEGAFKTDPLWSEGSAEERFFRHNTDYLGRRAAGKVWLGANLVASGLVNFIPFAIMSWLVGRLIRYSYDLPVMAPLAESGANRVRVTGVASALLAVALLLVVIIRRALDPEPEHGPYRVRNVNLGMRPALWLASLWALMAAYLLAVPALVDLYAGALVGLGGEATPAFGSGIAVVFVVLVPALVAGVVAAVVALGSESRAGRFAGSLVASICGLVIALVPVLIGIGPVLGARLFAPLEILKVLMALAILVGLAAWSIGSRPSLHLYYRERLASVFVVRRTADGVSRLDFGHRVFLSTVWRLFTVKLLRASPEERRNMYMPIPIFCAAVSLSDRVLPPGRLADSFAFSPQVSGGPVAGWWSTRALERATGDHLELTLPSIMAIAGGAISPLMGRYTVSQLRFVLTAANARLGAWIPNPQHDAFSGLDSVSLGKAEEVKPKSSKRPSKPRSFGGRGPGSWYVAKEALGLATRKQRFVHVADGGHFDNLGILELLRRRVAVIVAIDASAPGWRSTSELGHVISLARSELNVDIGPDRSDGEGDFSVETTGPVAVLEIRYPDSDGRRVNESAFTGRLLYCRPTVWRGAPLDVVELAERDRSFPFHSIRQQYFRDEEFEGYRALGYSIGLEASRALSELSDEPRVDISDPAHRPDFGLG